MKRRYVLKTRMGKYPHDRWVKIAEFETAEDAENTMMGYKALDPHNDYFVFTIIRASAAQKKFAKRFAEPL